jgi:hypothetical protein
VVERLRVRWKLVSAAGVAAEAVQRQNLAAAEVAAVVLAAVAAAVVQRLQGQPWP